MIKKEAIEKLIEKHGFVPFIQIFDLFKDGDDIHEELIRIAMDYPGTDSNRKLVIFTSAKNIEIFEQAFHEAMEEALTKPQI